MKSTNPRLSALALAVFSAIASPNAFADDAFWYGGANIGQSRARVDDARITSGLSGQGFSTTSINDDNRSNGYKIFGGYQINNTFGVEGGYFDLGKFGFRATTLPTGTLTGDIRLKGLNLDLVGTVPITDRFSAFGRAGLNYARASDSFTGTGAVQVLNPNPSKSGVNPKLGVGLQYAFTESLAMRAEAERYRVHDAVGNKGDINLFSIGLIYRFGGKTPAPAPVARAYEPPPAPVIAAAPPPPAPAPAPAPRTERYVLSATELFGFDSSQLRMPQPKLDEVASALSTNRDISNVVITGYTDRIGSSKYNQKLSERRAVTVKNYLTSKGVDANRLKAEGRGEANPVVVCTDKKLPALIKCLEPNRRVEIENINLQRTLR
jgi:OOP family OmpA-OmpF porin